MKCPFCKTILMKKNRMDKGHLNIHNIGLKKKERNNNYIYVCPGCNGLYQSYDKLKNYQLPVDFYFKRYGQYSRNNLDKGVFKNDE